MALPDLLPLLCCPETHQPLRFATAEELARVNREILPPKAAADSSQSLVQGLVREDGRVLYPVWDEIPCLIPGQGIPLDLPPGPVT